MPSASLVVRSRRRSRDAGSRWNPLAGVLMTMVVLITVVVGGTSAGIAYLYLDFAQSVPAVEDVAAFFGPSSDPSFTPIRIYDSTGEHVLAEWTNPAAKDRQWVSLNPADSNAAPQVLIQAILAAQDPQFWDAPAVTAPELGMRMLRDLLPFSPSTTHLSLAEHVASSTLLPLETYADRSLRRDFRVALLGERLQANFDREQILTWYLNSADFGSMAFGADAASLVYFGKHAHHLDLAESAMLAALPSDPGLNPLRATDEARRQQGDVLTAMLKLGYINQRQASVARAEELEFAPHGDMPAADARSDLSQLVLQRFQATYGRAAEARGGLRIITSIDYDLQRQAECTLETHLARLAGEAPATTVLTDDGRPCLAAGFLPPVRPSDSNMEHDVGEAAAIVSDPATGELLALANLPDAPGTAQAAHPAGGILNPVVYLTAFARGYAPGSMVLDLPPDGNPSSGNEVAYHGPVRMRTALANGYSAAAVRTMDLVGADNVLRTARQLGVAAPAVSADHMAGEASLMNLSFAYGVLANQGAMTGAASAGDSQVGTPSYILVTRIEDVYGHITFEEQSTTRSVVSPQLAYLMDDVLSDDSARWPTLGQGNVLDIGRPAAAVTSLDPTGSGNWTVGYTPELVVGVWIGSGNESPMRRVDVANGAAPIWRALIQYASRDQPRSDWALPPGMSEIDVCDPSGLLPTQYCPQIVKEVFIQGTEPTAADNFYQPFKIDVETGKLATLFTPLDQVEEKVFLVPPPEALSWAQSAGIDKPPQEYDPIDTNRPTDRDVHLSSPDLFAVVGGEIQLRGTARGDGFQYFRLQYGKGLNPDQWVQIGDDQSRPTSNGLLATWDSRGLNGLYTIQLQVVGRDGQIKTDALPLTLDNLSPSVSVVSPSSGEVLAADATGRVLIDCEVSDDHDVSRVTFEIDGRVVGSVTAPPFSLSWRPTVEGHHTLVVNAFDEVGNLGTSGEISFTTQR